MLGTGQAAGLGVQMQHAVAEPLVVAVDLVDDLLGAADQGGAALGEVLQGGEDRFDAEPLLEAEVALEDRPVVGEGLLGGGRRVEAGRARADRGQRRVVAVVLPPLAVVADQLGVGLDGVGDVRREERVAVAGGEVDRLAAGGAAVPDPDRPLVRPGPDLRVGERGPELRRRGDLLVAPDLPEDLVRLGVAVPLVLGGDLEQLALRGAVALADDQFEPPPERWSSVA